MLDTGSMSWRKVEDRPWTGEILGTALVGDNLYVVSAAPRTGAGQSLVAALDLGSGKRTESEQVPTGVSVGGVTTDGERLIVAGTLQNGNNHILSLHRNPVVYQYTQSQGWSQLPDAPIDGQAATIEWVHGVGLLAWNHELDSALLDSAANWNPISKVPMDISECYPHSQGADDGIVAFCGGLAYFEAASTSWIMIPTTHSARYVVTNDAVYELAHADDDQLQLSRYPLAR